MKLARITILYIGRDGGTPSLLGDLLNKAGYQVTTSKRASRDLGDVDPDLVVGDSDDFARRPGKERAVVLTGTAGAHPDDAPSPGRRRAGPGNTMNLQQLREHVRKTQGDVARRAAVSQPQLSRVEGRRDHLVSTLRKYVRALGGDVQVVAEIGPERIILRDV